MVSLGPERDVRVGAGVFILPYGCSKQLGGIGGFGRRAGGFLRRRHGDLRRRLRGVVFLYLRVPEEVFQKKRRLFPLVVYRRKRQALARACEGNVKQAPLFLNL